MPPKSKKASLWTTCESCESIITTKESKNHLQECHNVLNSLESWTIPFVHSNCVNTYLDFNNSDETKHINQNVIDNLVFIHHSLMQMCNFTIGQPVLIKSTNLPSMVKNVWPIYNSTQNLLTASIYINGIDLSWKNKNNFKVSISKLNTNPIDADIITVLCNDSEMINSSEFKNFVTISQKNRIVSKPNSMQVTFFGRNVLLKIKDINDNTENEWFIINDSTKWIFYQDQIEESNQTVCKDIIIGGMDDIISNIESLIQTAMNNNKNFTNMNLTKCVLLYGPSGVGKTLICKYITTKSNFNIVNISSTEIYSKFFGETESTLRKCFNDAIKNSPSIIMIDDIDILCSKKTSSSTEQEQRVLSTMASLLESIHNRENVFILSTTNKLDNIDPILRRYGRIDHEIEISVPTKDKRLDIMKKHFKSFPHTLCDKDIIKLSESTHGFVGADISNLNTQAIMHAMKARGLNDNLLIELNDFEAALKQVKPSAMREVLIDVPNVKWSDIGGQIDLKLKLKQAVEWPLKHGDSFVRLGIKPPSGLLMYGPPGCSKTMIAKALANESGLNFLSIKGPELFSKWVGESERAVREVFRKARQLAPSIIFFDEIDALSGERSKSGSGSNVQERVLAQILTELDGISPLGNVTIVAATNRPDKIDSALLRPGRLDRIVYVPLPDDETRRSIFEIKFKKMPIDENVILEELIDKTKNYSGAEVQAVCHEAALKALEGDINCVKVSQQHFDMALKMIQPRTPLSLLEIYNKFEKSFL